MATIDVSVSKSAQKNKKRREKKKQKEPTTTPDDEKDEVNEEPDPVVDEPNPIDLIKQNIEEAKLAKVRLPVLHTFMHKIMLLSLHLIFTTSIYRRATYFQGYRISRIVKNLLYTKNFVDEFSRIQVKLIVGAKVFKDRYFQGSINFSKIFILKNKSSSGIHMLFCDNL